MNLAKTAIERPIWVAVSIVLIFLLGLLSIRDCRSSCSPTSTVHTSTSR